MLNALVSEVISTLDTLSNSDKHPNVHERAKDIKKLLSENMTTDNFDYYWVSHGKFYIDTINLMVSQESSSIEKIKTNRNVIIPLASVFTLAFSVFTIFYGMITDNNRDKKTKKADKDKMYQQLEFASIECFKWEAEKNDQLVIIRDKFFELEEETKVGKDGEDDEEPKSPKEIRKNYQKIITPQQEILLETWCAMELNLFELIIESTLEDAARGDVFVTWLPWIFEAAHEPGFKQIWKGRLSMHYLGDCNNVIEDALSSKKKKEFVKKIIENYSKKHKTLKMDTDVLKEWMKWENMD